MELILDEDPDLREMVTDLDVIWLRGLVTDNDIGLVADLDMFSLLSSLTHDELLVILLFSPRLNCFFKQNEFLTRD